MTAKEVIDALLRLVEILFSWPVIFLVVALLVRRELPTLISRLAERVTKAPGGFEFAVLQQKVNDLTTKVAKLENVDFQPSAALTPELQKSLEDAVAGFQEYLVKLGHKPQTSHVVVLVNPAEKDNAFNNAYFDGTRIVLGEPLARDTDAVFREYSNHALVSGLDLSGRGNEWGSIQSALADYFPCSFNDDPLFGERSIHLFQDVPELQGKTAIRDLGNTRRFDKLPADAEIHDAGEVWGGAFWEMRESLGQATADALLFSTWEALRPARADRGFRTTFVKKLLELAESGGGRQQAGAVRAIFKRRGMKIR